MRELEKLLCVKQLGTVALIPCSNLSSGGWGWGWKQTGLGVHWPAGLAKLVSCGFCETLSQNVRLRATGKDIQMIVYTGAFARLCV